MKATIKSDWRGLGSRWEDQDPPRHDTVVTFKEGDVVDIIGSVNEDGTLTVSLEEDLRPFLGIEGQSADMPIDNLSF